MREPSNQQMEYTVLGGMMNGEMNLYDALEIVTEDYFTDSSAKKIYQSISEYEGHISKSVLMKNESDPKIKSAIQTADSAYSTPDDFTESLKGLKEKYLKRQLYYTMKNAESRFDETKYEELVSYIDQEISNFDVNDNGKSIIRSYDRAPEALNDYQERRANPDLAKGLPFSYTNMNGATTGLPSLDGALNGAMGGDLIMIAAKTGEGKTALALNIARMFSFQHNYKGYYLNTEMKIEELEARLLAPIAQVNSNEILTGRLTGTTDEIERKDNKVVEAYDRYMKVDLTLSHVPDLHIQKIKSLAKKVKTKHGMDYLVVDYIGRVDVLGFRGETWDRLYKITQELKELAATLDIPILMLAQRNQAGDVEGAKKMMNECDAVLYFEPVTSDDREDIEKYFRPMDVEKINYKIIKKKMRRSDKGYPIYLKFAKDMSYVTELKQT